MNFRKKIKFVHGFDCINFECRWGSESCKPGEDGSHGIGSMNIIFLLYGSKGAVQFKLNTGWAPYYSKKSKIGVRALPNNYVREYYPSPTDLGYHSYKPMYEDHISMGKCDVLGGKECYYDGSSLNSQDAFYVLVNAGEEELWNFLEKYYECVFNGGDYPEVKEYPFKRRG